MPSLLCLPPAMNLRPGAETHPFPSSHSRPPPAAQRPPAGVNFRPGPDRTAHQAAVEHCGGPPLSPPCTLQAPCPATSAAERMGSGAGREQRATVGALHSAASGPGWGGAKRRETRPLERLFEPNLSCHTRPCDTLIQTWPLGEPLGHWTIDI